METAGRRAQVKTAVPQHPSSRESQAGNAWAQPARWGQRRGSAGPSSQQAIFPSWMSASTSPFQSPLQRTAREISVQQMTLQSNLSSPKPCNGPLLRAEESPTLWQGQRSSARCGSYTRALTSPNSTTSASPADFQILSHPRDWLLAVPLLDSPWKPPPSHFLWVDHRVLSHLSPHQGGFLFFFFNFVISYL